MPSKVIAFQLLVFHRHPFLAIGTQCLISALAIPAGSFCRFGSVRFFAEEVRDIALAYRRYPPASGAWPAIVVRQTSEREW